VSPNAGAIGHAAGVAAGLCAKNIISVHKLDYNELKHMLLKQGAYLG